MIRSWFCVLGEISCLLISVDLDATLFKDLPSMFTSANTYKLGPGEYRCLRELCSFPSQILDLTRTVTQKLSYIQNFLKFFWGAGLNSYLFSYGSEKFQGL